MSGPGGTGPPRPESHTISIRLPYVTQALQNSDFTGKSMTRILKSLSEIAPLYDALFCDLWGCVHDGIRPYPAAVDPYPATPGQLAPEVGVVASGGRRREHLANHARLAPERVTCAGRRRELDARVPM